MRASLDSRKEISGRNSLVRAGDMGGSGQGVEYHHFETGGAQKYSQARVATSFCLS